MAKPLLVAAQIPLLALLAAGVGTGPPSSVWRPEQGTRWQWQLSGTIDTSVDVPVYDIDLFDAPTATIQLLHDRGARVICYFSFGSYEEWRDDAPSFPESVLGNDLDGWEGERWLDVRALDVLGPIMSARLDVAVAKGCDAVEPDNMDGFINDPGFPLSYNDQLVYNQWIATEAHSKGLGVGLKNDLDQIEELEPLFDFAVNEQCFQYDECDTLQPFLDAGKAVLSCEYRWNLGVEATCAEANAMGMSTIFKDFDLLASPLHQCQPEPSGPPECVQGIPLASLSLAGVSLAAVEICNPTG